MRHADFLLLYPHVQEVLWKEWDPIGVNTLGGPDDEYDAYASKITHLILARATRQELTNHLLKLETESMGLQGNEAECCLIAERLLALAGEHLIRTWGNTHE